MTWVVPPEWIGETAFILGCGPSLATLHAYDIAHKGRVIAINDAYLKFPKADVLYFGDKKWWNQNWLSVAEHFLGHWIVTMDNRIEGVKTLRCSGDTGLDEDPGSLRHGSNSGYQAIHLAYHFGATRIVLLGFDMRCVDGRVHWQHRRAYENSDAQARVMRQHFLPKFPTLAQPLLRAGVSVINSTPNSALQTWPYVPLQEVLNGKEASCNTAV